MNSAVDQIKMYKVSVKLHTLSYLMKLTFVVIVMKRQKEVQHPKSYWKKFLGDLRHISLLFIRPHKINIDCQIQSSSQPSENSYRDKTKQKHWIQIHWKISRSPHHHLGENTFSSQTKYLTTFFREQARNPAWIKNRELLCNIWIMQ